MFIFSETANTGLVAREWYADKLSPTWRRKTLDEAEAVLRQIGLTGPFWDLR